MGQGASGYGYKAFPHCHPIIVGLNLVKLACLKENFSPPPAGEMVKV